MSRAEAPGATISASAYDKREEEAAAGHCAVNLGAGRPSLDLSRVQVRLAVTVVPNRA